MLNSQTRTKADIARENGAKSHGPVTLEGKARSSQNAATHSLSTINVVCLTHEDQQRYDAHHQSYVQCWKPENIMEVELVEEMAAAKWQERRCQSIETAILNMGIQMQPENLSPGDRTALAFMDLADHSKVLQLLLRYSTEHSRRFHRAVRQLIALRKSAALAGTEKRNEPTAASKTNKTSAPPPPVEAQPATEQPEIPAREVPAVAVPLVFRNAA